MTILGRIRLSLGRCPPGWKLTRAVSGGLDADVGWHLSACRRCADQYRELRRLQHAVANMPGPQMPEDVRRAIAMRLLATPFTAAAPARRPSLRWMAMTAVAVVALGLAGLWAALRAPGASRSAPVAQRGRAQPSHASIRAIGGARFARVQPPPDEIVRVDDGTIQLEVTPLVGRERFRVVTGDGEVEVRGTSFQVSAAAGRLVAVHVWRGRVDVRSQGGVMNVLDAGDEWVSNIARPPFDPARGPALPSSATPTPTPTPASAPPLARAPARVAAKVASSAALRSRHESPRTAPPAPRASFDVAWALLRKGDARAAAAEFETVARSSSGTGIVEDALYWRSVALTRAGDQSRAREALAEFVARFPGSPRIGEASVMLGWSLIQAGDRVGARSAFRQAVADPADDVRASAREGMARTQP